MHESDTGLILSGLDWLIAHHKAKEKHRRQMVEDLRLQPGDRLLDLASGPGLWTTLFAEQVKPNGKVVGVDISANSIEFARKALTEYPTYQDVVEYKQGSFDNIPYDDNCFDVVFCANCLNYSDSKQREQILQEQKRVTKPGGRVISKEFDEGATMYYPVPPELMLKVKAAMGKTVTNNLTGKYFDHFVGRQMRELFLSGGFQNVSTRFYPTPIFSPLTEKEKKYLFGFARWFSKAASPYLSEIDKKMWDSYFDPTSSEYILDREDFYFCEVAIFNVGIV